MLTKRFLILANLTSLVIAIVFVYMALDHNPMGEYCTPISEEECDINFMAILPIFVLWYAVVFSVLAIIKILYYAVFLRNR